MWEREDASTDGLVHHIDRPVPLDRNTERLAEAGIEPSVGSRGDSSDNALAETIIGLYKTEAIRRRGPWRGVREDWQASDSPLGTVPKTASIHQSTP